MQINIHAIREQRGAQLPVQGVSPAPPLEAAGGPVTCGPVEVSGSVTNVGKGFLVKARLRCECESQCTRCLAPFRYVLEPEMEEMYYPERLRGTQPEGDDVANWYTGDVLDLTDAIRETLQLALPMKQVCREDCKGLCPRCGHDLNQGPCGCTVQETDARWAPLAALLRDGHEHRG
ncbi:MAG TPA: DUF177 domain-containing protein [Limnochordales bacterium]